MRIKAILTIIVIALVLMPIGFRLKENYVVMKIEEGDNLEIISKKLKEAKVIQDRLGFKLLVLLHKKSRSLSYGWYKFRVYENPRTVLRSLLEGRRITIKITIPEGLKINETINVFRRHKDSEINIVKLDSLTRDVNFIEKLGIEAPTLEGYLFPDTYIFYKEEKAENVIKKMVSSLFTVLDSSKIWKIQSMDLTTHEIITIASMIEREAMTDREKPIIASVIYNRLKKNMPLQIDATVIYTLGKHKRRVLYEDLKIKSAYNTYRNTGLPPGPIASPGYQSIISALHPAKTDYLYYVATGKGDHIFSRTYKEHLEAKKKVQGKH
jgi:UPF0755 protein